MIENSDANKQQTCTYLSRSSYELISLNVAKFIILNCHLFHIRSDKKCLVLFTILMSQLIYKLIIDIFIYLQNKRHQHCVYRNTYDIGFQDFVCIHLQENSQSPLDIFLNTMTKKLRWNVT